MRELMPKALVIHGGAGSLDMSHSDDVQNLRAKTMALTRIVHKGWEELSKDVPSLDVATNTIVRLENAEPFNAGYGSSIGFDENGGPMVALDASIMTHADNTYTFGGVTGITCVQNPILVARAVLDKRANLLHGAGANDLAKEVALQNHTPILENQDLMTKYKLQKFQEYNDTQVAESREGGTVGVVVFDGKTMVAATSTGGTTGKALGRTGDSCIPGAGTYADAVGAASATGYGEAIMLQGSTRRAIQLLGEDCPPDEAAQTVAEELRESYDGNGGIIIVNKYGQIGVSTNTSHMPNAYMNNRMQAPVVRIK